MDRSISAKSMKRLLDTDVAAVSAGASKRKVCFVVTTRQTHTSSGGSCSATQEVREHGSYVFAPCWNNSRRAVAVGGVAPDGVQSVELLDAGRVVVSGPVKANGFFVVAEDGATAIRIGQWQEELDNSMCSSPTSP
jgi:hypothetical protein